ncbi:hypothetical protein [Nannocystis radixulma]|uniref:Uncharacterized protein n=1 Tax=Nannocystis radixulma TaxID=2995305 RepID=A0ABT5B2I2_9BACT|nr:hypothetical protein [Nannocystis radixulma]MDC0668310.1 hypothetical protein [Nannocystis radixulma]
MAETDTAGAECNPEVCMADGQIHQCGDCLDNDGDGGADCTDVECFGPCDDSEEVFGSPLEDKDPCKQDCYFDGNGGQGGGDCQWNLKCDELEPGGPICKYNPGLDFDKCVDGDAETCKDNCEAPNGCDCFGCCTIGADDYFIGSPDCSADNLEDCNPCTKQEWCNNPCDDGEVCYPEVDASECAG